MLQGQRGVAAYNAVREQAGRPVRGEEVTLETPLGRRRVDLIEVDPATGEATAVEIKSGRSPYKPLQRAKDQEIEAGRARGVGARAQQAGVEGPVQLKTRLERVP